MKTVRGKDRPDNPVERRINREYIIYFIIKIFLNKNLFIYKILIFKNKYVNKMTAQDVNRFLGTLNGITKVLASLECCCEDMSLTKLELLALSVISNQKELIMSQLAGNLGVSMSTATGIIDKLVEKELVSRERNHGDRRVVKVVLTAKGEEIAISFQKQKEEMVKRIMELLSPEEQETFISILEKISEKLRG